MTNIKWLIAIIVVILGLTCSETVSAQSSRHLRLEVFGTCPDAVELRVELARLMPDLLVKTTVRNAPLMTVGDVGARYVVAYGKSKVDIEDAARNCEERARTAAVFVATLLAPPKLGAPPVARFAPAGNDEDGAATMPPTTQPELPTSPPPLPALESALPPAKAPAAKPQPVPPVTVISPTQTQGKRWFKDIAGGVLAGAGTVVLITGLGLLIDHASQTSDQFDSFDAFSAARGRTDERTAGIALSAIGGGLLLGAAIRYAVVAHSPKRRFATNAPTLLGWVF